IENQSVTTVEGLKSRPPLLDSLQRAFLRHGAAQCGACTPGMLVAGTALIESNPNPSEQEVMDALGGVLCRCTGYRKIIDAVRDARTAKEIDDPPAGAAVGQRLVRVDGRNKVEGSEIFGADAIPKDALGLRVVRCPFHRARFSFGDLDGFVRENP